MKPILAMMTGLVLGTWAGLATAHHSYAAFDMTTSRTVEGAVRVLEWTNPHVWLWVDVTDATGKIQNYGFETVSPGQLARDYSWSRGSLKAGDRVKVDFAPLRDGSPGGALRAVTLPDGRKLTTRLASAWP